MGIVQVRMKMEPENKSFRFGIGPTRSSRFRVGSLLKDSAIKIRSTVGSWESESVKKSKEQKRNENKTYYGVEIHGEYFEVPAELH